MTVEESSLQLGDERAQGVRVGVVGGHEAGALGPFREGCHDGLGRVRSGGAQRAAPS